jgi:hypothetical protein
MSCDLPVLLAFCAGFGAYRNNSNVQDLALSRPGLTPP